MNKPLLIIPLSVLVFFSCSKDEATSCESTIISENYYPLAVGNYWVYDRYSVNNDSIISFSGQDSVVIVSDTLINGETYYVHESFTETGSPGLANYGTVRDSSGYRVNSTGIILFSTTDDSDTLAYAFNQEVAFDWWVTSFMDLIPQSISVPAGTYDCLEYIGRIETDAGGGTLENYPKFLRTHYANGVGRVKFNLHWFSSTSEIVYELNRFHLE